MSQPIVPAICSFMTLLFVSVSYFFKKKSTYLILQASSVVCMVLCYVFISNYIGVLSLCLGLVRVSIYYILEQKNKKAPVWVVMVFCGLTVLNYFLINALVQNGTTAYDWILVASMCLYAIVFSIRNLNVLRYLVTIPLALSTIYNWLIDAPIFSTLSYLLELVVAIVSIIYFAVQNRQWRAKKQDIIPKH